MDIKIAKVLNEYRVVINKGSDDGIRDGQRVLIYAMGAEISDPDTGKSLGNLEVVKGTGRVTHCQPKVATVSSDMTANTGRTIRRKVSSPLSSLLHSMRSVQDVEEEILPEKTVPFEGVDVGDSVRMI